MIQKFKDSKFKNSKINIGGRAVPIAIGTRPSDKLNSKIQEFKNLS